MNRAQIFETVIELLLEDPELSVHDAIEAVKGMFQIIPDAKTTSA